MAEMVSELLCQWSGLEGERRQAFLDWLQAHCRSLELGACSQAEMECALMGWFECLAPAGILWEFLLLMREISWWQSRPGQGLTEEEVKCSSF